MEIEIYSPSQDEQLAPIKWNYEELKAQLTEGLASYKSKVYDEKNISEAKKDRASLNKLATAIDNRRKEMKERFLQPYEEFEKQAKELSALVKEQSAEIDAQVKAFDEARKAEKLVHIKEKYVEVFGNIAELVPFEKIQNKKWLNVTTSMSSIEDDLTSICATVNAGMDAIDKLEIDNDIRHRVQSVFLDTLDLAAAIAEKERIENERQAIADYEAAKKAAEIKAEDIKAQNKKARQPEPVGYAVQENKEVFTVDFRIHATNEQLQMLKAFLVDNGIKYGRVPRN